VASFIDGAKMRQGVEQILAALSNAQRFIVQIKQARRPSSPLDSGGRDQLVRAWLFAVTRGA
jgi:hypothetical protein